MRDALYAIIFTVGVVATLGTVLTSIVPAGGDVLRSAFCSTAPTGGAESPVQCLREWSNGIAALAALLAAYIAWRSVQVQLQDSRRAQEFSNTHLTLNTIKGVESTIETLINVDVTFHIELDHRDTTARTPVAMLEEIFASIVRSRKELMIAANRLHLTFMTPVGDDIDKVFYVLSESINTYTKQMIDISSRIKPIITPRSKRYGICSDTDVDDFVFDINAASSAFRDSLVSAGQSLDRLSEHLERKLTRLS